MISAVLDIGEADPRFDEILLRLVALLTLYDVDLASAAGDGCGRDQDVDRLMTLYWGSIGDSEKEGNLSEKKVAHLE